MRKKYNIKRIRQRRNYKIAEAAAEIGVRRSTISVWANQKNDPLPMNRYQRPFLIKGIDLRNHILKIHASYKSPLKPGELWCMRCKRGCAPEGMTCNYRAQSPLHGIVKATCESCRGQLSRGVSAASLSTVMPGVTIISKGAV